MKNRAGLRSSDGQLRAETQAIYTYTCTYTSILTPAWKAAVHKHAIDARQGTSKINLEGEAAQPSAGIGARGEENSEPVP